MPCIFMMYVLASAGAPIILQDEVIVTTLNYNETSNALVSNSTETTQAKQVSIVNPVWVTVHLLFFIMLVIYFIWNMLQLLVKRD